MNSIPVNCYGVAAIILKKFDNTFKVLLMQRAKSLRGTWCYVAGSIEAGEKAWEAALREIKEETNLVPSKLYSGSICEQFYEIRKDSIWIAPVFIAYISDDQEVGLNEENIDYKWVTIEEALQMLSFPGQNRILNYVDREFIKKKPTDWLLIETKEISVK